MTDYVAVPGLRMRDHWISTPLDYSDPAGTTIEVYAREVVGPEHADPAALPWLLFLQGGPGGKGPRPLSRSGWLDKALASFRVLLLDQRGTGRSAPLQAGTAPWATDPAALAAQLACLRADSIVRDAEQFRATVGGGQPWYTLGQSYGGFCTFSYLSMAPEGLRGCLVTGGVPPIGLRAAEVYRRTWPRVIAKNAEYFARYPADRAVLARVRDLVDGQPLPTGGTMSIDRLQAVGIAFGTSTGFGTVHHLLEEAVFAGRLSDTFLRQVADLTDQADSPLYALLQEAIYCEGAASRWAADRTRVEHPALARDADRLLFTGEMMERWRFAAEPALSAYADAAGLLHAKDDWGPLYDDRLAANTVPVAAAVYFDDMYVDADASLAVAGNVPGVRTWVTNQYEHDGLRADAAVFTRLHRMLEGLE